LSILHLPLSLACPFFICLCLWLVHSSFAFVSGLSILHLPLSLACPFFICLCLWLVHSSFAFVSGLSIFHLPLSLTCPFFICLQFSLTFIKQNHYFFKSCTLILRYLLFSFELIHFHSYVLWIIYSRFSIRFLFNVY
jgi:hypothetical protein